MLVYFSILDHTITTVSKSCLLLGSISAGKCALKATAVVLEVLFAGFVVLAEHFERQSIKIYTSLFVRLCNHFRVTDDKLTLPCRFSFSARAGHNLSKRGHILGPIFPEIMMPPSDPQSCSIVYEHYECKQTIYSWVTQVMQNSCSAVT